MGNNPSEFQGSERPIECVSWYDAVEFCNKLSELEGFEKVYSGSHDGITCDFDANGYRLPTEAEWEYSARGGSNGNNHKYSGSNQINEVAWYGAYENIGNRTKSDGTANVGRKNSNEIGLFDMSGNVEEWCWDRYEKYDSGSYINPRGGNYSTSRVLRGGSWCSDPERCRVVYRDCGNPEYSSNNKGFRLVRSEL